MERTKLVDADPSGLFGGVMTLLGATITLVVAFGVTLTADQTAAILGFAAAAGPFATALLIRRKAWSPQSHFREVEEASLRQPPAIEEGLSRVDPH